MSNSDNDFEPHKTDTFSVTVSDKLSGTTVFTPDIDEPLRIVNFFYPSLKYASFKVSRDVDVGLNLCIASKKDIPKRMLIK